MAQVTVRIRYEQSLELPWMLDFIVDTCPAWSFNWVCYCEKRVGHDEPHWAYADSWEVGRGYPGGFCDDA